MLAAGGAAAAFGRLCVETISPGFFVMSGMAAAFGRLCVETRVWLNVNKLFKQPPSGGCVLKQVVELGRSMDGCSRLRAAVC